MADRIAREDRGAGRSGGVTNARSDNESFLAASDNGGVGG
jgi:hypothetical protein